MLYVKGMDFQIIDMVPHTRLEKLVKPDPSRGMPLLVQRALSCVNPTMRQIPDEFDRLMIVAKNCHPRIGLAMMVVLLATGLSSTVLAASQLLRCEIKEGGETYIADFLPTSDPYTVVAKNIGERFRLKVVMLLNEQTIEYIKIYTYYKDPHSMVLLHIAEYLPPFGQNQPSFAALTGVNYVYSPELERELQYGCGLFNIPP